MTASSAKKAPRRLSPEEINDVRAGEPRVPSRAANTTGSPTADSRSQAHVLPIGQTQTATVKQSTTSPKTMSNVCASVDTHNGTVWTVTAPGRINPEARPEFLHKVQPTGRREDIAIVKPQVIELVLATDVTSKDSLRALLGRGCKFGVWCLYNTPDGTFDPARDMNEARFHDYRVQALTELAPTSRATVVSSLRQLGTNAPIRRPFGRKAAKAPYPAGVTRRLWQTALELDDWVASEVRTLLALSFGCGARGEEIKDMRASQIEVNGRRVVVHITRQHVVREVPVYDEYAQWLRDRLTQLGPDDHLLRPTFIHRRNVVNNTVATAAARSDVFEGFEPIRARHTWVSTHLAIGMPFNALCFAAGVGAGSNLFVDLSPHLPHVTPADVRRAFDHAHSLSKDTA